MPFERTILSAGSRSPERLALIMGLFFAILLAGCASTVPRNAVPQQMAGQASLAGFQDVRFWSDAEPEKLNDLVALAMAQRAASADGKPPEGGKFLVLSGGGSDGAFGAGLLSGWTMHGTRPHFDIVTGISTGAIIAPFAFLGSRYDGWLEKFYTEYGSSDVLKPNWLSGLLGGSAVANSSPLEHLIAQFITPQLLGEIAAEYRKGRRLFIGTTNLDAQRPVTWDMSAIAAGSPPEALALFRKVVLASASVPLAFPPVRFDVQAGGKNYQELHVDGSITTPVFFLPSQVKLGDIDDRYKLSARRELYVIRNGRLDARYAAVNDDLVSLTDRAFATVSKNQTAGELLRLCLRAQRDSITYRLASIPQTFDLESREIFDREYMKALFGTGFALGRNGYDWKQATSSCDQP